MRRALAAVSIFLGLSGCAEYTGEGYSQVVKGSDVTVHDRLPDRYFVIGEVEADMQRTIDAQDDLAYELSCEVDATLVRRMKRVAARNGGEALVAVECFYDDYEEVRLVVEDGWIYEELELTCSTSCWAAVARHVSRSAD